MFETWKVSQRPVEVLCDVTQHLVVYQTAVDTRKYNSTFGEESFLLDRFLRDIDSRNHAINPVLEKKSDVHSPPFMVISERHDRQIDRQADKNPA